MKTRTGSSVARRVTAGAAAVATVGGAGLAFMAVGVGTASAAPHCVQAGDSGFTAAVVARPGQHISRWHVNATGCDVGIYVGPRTSRSSMSGVRIDRVTVTGASDAGILVQRARHVTITRSTVTDNGFNSPGEAALPQAFGISLFGVSDSTVTRNTVFNNGRGGIGLMDYGPLAVGQLLTHQPAPSTRLVPSDHNVISRNSLWANYNGCAIVLSAFNTGNHVRDDVVTRNTITGIGINANGADVGGIVAQTNGASSVVSNIAISRNTVIGSVESGVIVHAAAPNSRTVNVWVTRNRLSGDNLGLGGAGGPHPSDPQQLTGVVVDSLLTGKDIGAKAIHTVVSHNSISNEFYGVWSRGANAPEVYRNKIHVNAGGTQVFRVAP